jgi:hypothetical protein
MSDQEKFLTDCVITIISDDYESFEIILEQTRRLAVSRGLNVTEAEVAEALRHAISEGFAKAHLLSPHPPHSTRVEYSSEKLHELWFYVTPRGKNVAKSVPELGGES